MNARRDPERLIHAFLMEGQTELADQVYDAVRAEIEHKRQRVVIGPWRTPIMNKFVPIGLGAAAVVVAVVIGAQLLGPRAPSGVGGAPSAEPTATAEPSFAEPSEPVDGSLPEGPFVLTTPLGGAPVTVTIPAAGWYGEPGSGILGKKNSDPPGGAAIIGPWFGDLYVYGDPCHWSTTRPDAPATTVDEIVAALTDQASRDASAPVDVTIGRYAGKSITLHVPDDAVFSHVSGEAVFSQCDQGKFASWGVPGDDPARWHQGPGQVDEVWIVDVNGEPMVIDAMYGDETPAEHVAELRAIVESTTFE